MRFILVASLFLFGTIAHSNTIIGKQAEEILSKGEIITSGVKPDGATENNMVALVSYKGSLYLCEAYVNVSLSKVFIKCFDQ